MSNQEHDPSHRDLCDWNLYAEYRDEQGDDLCNLGCLEDTTWKIEDAYESYHMTLTVRHADQPGVKDQVVSFRLLRCSRCFALIAPEDRARHLETAHAPALVIRDESELLMMIDRAQQIAIRRGRHR